METSGHVEDAPVQEKDGDFDNRVAGDVENVKGVSDLCFSKDGHISFTVACLEALWVPLTLKKNATFSGSGVKELQCVGKTHIPKAKAVESVSSVLAIRNSHETAGRSSGAHALASIATI